MSHQALRIRGITKQYPIGGPQRSYGTIRESVMDGAKAPLRLARSFMRGERRRKKERLSFLALEDVGFDVEKGDVVGLVGRNGAGKSTLLKILSRITEPTAGFAEVYGRIGSLLEVGTGFHPELSGRENIFLNGAILGMKREEIRRQFDAIVEFAEVTKFVDTAVKHYSSGMYLRLAFAVAAHLQTEILLVDEVLAVGDLSFQRKCLGKMGDVANQGRTVIFVSHNMGAVRSLCRRGVVLDKGKVVEVGDVGAAVATYYKLATTSDIETEKQVRSGDRVGFGEVRLTSHESGTIQQGDSFDVSVAMRIPEEAAGFVLMCIMDDMHQRRVIHLRTDSADWERTIEPGLQEIKLRFPPMWLEPGLYSMHFKVLFQGRMKKFKYISDIRHIDVGGASSGWGAMLTPAADWSIRPANEPPLAVQPESAIPLH